GSTSRFNATYTVDNQVPSVSIVNPADGGSVGTANQAGQLSIKGNATDSSFRYYYCYVTTNSNVTINGHQYSAGQEVGSRGSLCETAWSTSIPGHAGHYAASTTGTKGYYLYPGSAFFGGNLGSIDLSGAPDGSYRAHLVSYDKAGNKAETANQFTLDNTGPSIANVTPADGAVVNGNIKVSADLSDPSGVSRSAGQGFVINQGSTSGRQVASGQLTDPNADGTFTASQGALDTTGWSDGTYYLTVNANDSNFNFSSQIISFVVDHTAPVVAITAPSYGDTVSGTVTISGTVTDNNPDHYYLVVKDANGKIVAGSGTVNSASVANYNWDTTKVKDGTYAIDLEARDAAGNKASASVKTINVTVDNTAPTTGITSASQTSQNTISFDGTVSDKNLNYYYCYLTTNQTITVNNKTYTPGEEVGTRDANCQTTFAKGQTSLPSPPGQLGSIDITGLPSGSYTVNLVAYDLAGNNNAPNPTTLAVAIGHTAPTVTTKQKPGGSSTVINNNNKLTITTSNFQTTASGNASTNGNASGGNTQSGNAGNSSSAVLGINVNNVNGQVLGAQTKTPSQTGNNATIFTKNASITKSRFLGLGWWWLLILAAIAALLTYAYRLSSKTETSSSNKK
ncbi:MAG: Ig-like domain-containing protein, partial [Candidatus Saccharimonadales bacterium]